MKKVLFKGCGTAIATPFNEDGVNYDVLKDFLEFQISNSVDSIIVCGTTGEASTMTDDEKKEVIKFTVDIVNKRVPVIAGTGGNSTSNVIALTKYAEKVGADGALIVTPYYNKTTQSGLITHYSAIANQSNIPIILYNVPSRTGVNIKPETCLELSKISNIVAIKEASGDISQVSKIAQLCGDNLGIYSGNDNQIIPILSIGGLGVISVLGNIEPKYVHEMVYEFLEGDLKGALNMQLSSLDLIDALFCEVNPIPIKEALNINGFDFGKPRLPLVPATENCRNALISKINQLTKISN